MYTADIRLEDLQAHFHMVRRWWVLGGGRARARPLQPPLSILSAGSCALGNGALEARGGLPWSGGQRPPRADAAAPRANRRPPPIPRPPSPQPSSKAAEALGVGLVSAAAAAQPRCRPGAASGAACAAAAAGLLQNMVLLHIPRLWWHRSLAHGTGLLRPPPVEAPPASLRHAPGGAPVGFSRAISAPRCRRRGRRPAPSPVWGGSTAGGASGQLPALPPPQLRGRVPATPLL